jgi:hypothetical protein
MLGGGEDAEYDGREGSRDMTGKNAFACARSAVNDDPIAAEFEMTFPGPNGSHNLSHGIFSSRTVIQISSNIALQNCPPTINMQTRLMLYKG